MNFRKTIKLEDRGPISTWLGDSRVWMQTAIEKDRKSGRGRVVGGDIEHHELNVAHVCAGLAFELAFKALAKSEGRNIIAKHESEYNYKNLSADSQTKIKNFVESSTTHKMDNLLEYLDERMCNPARKYWMVGKDGKSGGGTGFVTGIGELTIPYLANIHAEIVRMAGENAFESWEGEVSVARGKRIATLKLS